MMRAVWFDGMKYDTVGEFNGKYQDSREFKVSIEIDWWYLWARMTWPTVNAMAVGLSEESFEYVLCSLIATILLYGSYKVAY